MRFRVLLVVSNLAPVIRVFEWAAIAASIAAVSASATEAKLGSGPCREDERPRRARVPLRVVEIGKLLIT